MDLIQIDQSIEHADAPAYFNEPPFSVATHPAAAGLAQEAPVQSKEIDDGVK